MLTLKTTLGRLFNRPASPTRPRRERETRRLQMEWLEERTLLCNPGELDVTFGTGGKVITSVNVGSEGGVALALQTDGKSVVAGWTANGMAVLRYNTNGSLDTTFSGDGIQTVSFGKKTDQKAYAVAIQADGKIAAAGYTRSTNNVGTGYDFAIVRLNSNGSLDTSFGSGGKVSTNFASASGDVAYTVAIQADGKIVAAGGSSGDFALVRYNANGSLDTSFGSGGKVTTSITAANDSGRSVVILPDGKILLGGQVGANSGQDNSDFGLVRYNANGSIDTTFGTSGIVQTDFAGQIDGIRQIVVQPDGRIVAAGLAFDSFTADDFAAARYNADGSLDLSFNGTGKVTVAISNDNEWARGVALQTDGKIVMAGGGTGTFDLVRLNVDGSLDSTFGTSGIVTTDFGHDPEGAYGVAIQSDGQIITAGYIGGANGSDSDFALARYCA